MVVLLQRVPQLISALTCLERIQQFLDRDELVDFRSIDSRAMVGEQTVGMAGTQSYSPESIPLQTLRSNPSAAPCCIVVANGRFGWNKAKYILKDVNISIPKGQFTVVAGPVGSGKSTLCKSLLSEVPYSDGTITLFQGVRIGYCDQQPLANLSIRNNVVGFDSFVEERYERVLHATMLHIDLAMLPLGDQTVVGSGGLSLSGGHRQRLSIARASCATAVDTLILDDVLSGLDATTEEHVFRHDFGADGCTQQSGATVVLCTHDQRHVAGANQLIRISQNGFVRQEAIQRFARASDAFTERSPPSIPAPVVASSTVIVDTSSAESRGASARQVGDNTVYKYYLSSIRALPLVILLVSGVCYGFLQNFPRVWLSYWTHYLDRPGGALHSHEYWVGIYGVLQVSCWAALIATCLVVLTTFVNQSGAVLHQAALSTIMDATLRLFTQTDVGVYLLAMIQRCASLVTLMTLSESLVDFVTFYAAMETSIGAVTRIRALAQDTESEKVTGKDTLPRDSWPPHGEVIIQNAWTSYVDSPLALSLRELSVNIKPGEKVALCGRSGSGKSSFILLLLALLEPLNEAEHSTRLAIDGESLASIDRQALREKLITIPQDPVFLPLGSTIAQNLDPFGAASRDQCQDILEHVGLWSMVQDHGGSADAILQSSTLSQGQGQLFSLARAVLKRRISGTSLLLLDEFTSSVDAATESRMMETMMGEFQNATVIMVSHRLGVVVDMFERVLAMDNSQLVEDGAPRTLARTEGSWFAQLLHLAQDL